MTTQEKIVLLHDTVEHYYTYNPDTLMPMYMLALAMTGHLSISERSSKPSKCICSICPEEIKDFEWVTLNDTLSKRVAKWCRFNVKHVCVEADEAILPDVYQILKENDEVTVVQEHHHRLGRLVHHSSNEASEEAERQYATLLLAETLLLQDKRFLHDCYISIFNHMLVRSGLQPERPRMLVAEWIYRLLNYDGTGLVYNPFAGCSIAGAMLESPNFYADGDTNKKIHAVARLLNHGMGTTNEHFVQRDSKEWLPGKKINYVISTYLGNVGEETAFDFCLGKCLEDKSFKGKYVGMIKAKALFENPSPAFTEAISRDWIESIVVLPIGEVAVLVNAYKEEIDCGNINLYDLTSPMMASLSAEDILSDYNYANIIDNNDALVDGFLKSILAPENGEIEGYEKYNLCDFVTPIEKNVYDLKDFDEDERIIVDINRDEDYNGNRWGENLYRRPVNNIFTPAYRLEGDCLIVNKSGKPQPRLFNGDEGAAFFTDGYAFRVDNIEIAQFLVSELNSPYVLKQLHPYGESPMLSEPFSEEDILNVVLYTEATDMNEEEDLGGEDENMDDILNNLFNNEESDYLEPGTELLNNGKIYTILNFIGNGSFGYTYRATMQDIRTGVCETVVLKEYYPSDCCHREYGRVVPNSDEMIEYFNENKFKFIEEAKIMMTIGKRPDSHVMDVKALFENEETGTAYYVMKLYTGGTLLDMVRSNSVPKSEFLIINKLVIPLCKALNAMHSEKILHLDIKPENVLIDDNGEAVIIDFGVAQQYDESGNLIGYRGTHSCSPFSSPENTEGIMMHFEAEPDIFGVAATLFYALTGGYFPHAVRAFSEDEMQGMDLMNCSAQMKEAVMSGLRYFITDRPNDALQFVRNFPGCENVLL